MKYKLKLMAKSIISKLSSPFPLSGIHLFLGINLLIPCWHAVSDNPIECFRPDTKPRDIKTFISDLEYFLQFYCPVETDDVINHFIGLNKFKRISFLPTFDDGFKEAFEAIAPILQKKGISAIFFITKCCVDNKELIYPHKINLLIRRINAIQDSHKIKAVNDLLFQNNIYGSTIIDKIKRVKFSQRTILDKIAEVINLDFTRYLNEKRPYLTSDQINSLVKMGFEIGSHSIDHPKFSELSLDEQIYQVRESAAWLSNTFNINCRTFAFPYADDHVSDEFYQMIANTTDIKLIMGNWGFLTTKKLKNIPRLLMESEIPKAKDLVRYELLKYLFNNYIRKNLQIASLSNK